MLGEKKKNVEMKDKYNFEKDETFLYIDCHPPLGLSDLCGVITTQNT